MTSSSSSSAMAIVILQPTIEELSKNNHTTWPTQVLATLHGAHLEGYITGKKKAPEEEIKEKHGDQKVMVPNPAYEDWRTKDQQVFSFILASVTKEILVHIAMATSATKA
jgi:hypothetical protein